MAGSKSSKRTAAEWRDAEALIEDGVIVIRLRVKNIPNAMAHSPEALFDGVEVVDLGGFAKDVVAALNDEDEEGTTPIHRLLDAAIDKAIEDGSLHVEIAEAEAAGWNFVGDAPYDFEVTDEDGNAIAGKERGT